MKERKKERKNERKKEKERERERERRKEIKKADCHTHTNRKMNGLLAEMKRSMYEC